MQKRNRSQRTIARSCGREFAPNNLNLVTRPRAKKSFGHSCRQPRQRLHLRPLDVFDAPQRHMTGELLFRRLSRKALRRCRHGPVHLAQLPFLIVDPRPDDAGPARARKKTDPLGAQFQRREALTSPSDRLGKSVNALRFHTPQDPQRQVKLLTGRPANPRRRHRAAQLTLRLLDFRFDLFRYRYRDEETKRLWNWLVQGSGSPLAAMSN